ncbi:3-phosphoshikimate 1-carboxyvinyltransferase [Metallosphaera hakonensis]|uniref:3-phosphoshikimate 1-carboxyvinyltransferase n=1 Tax=Metallosphaera hakonensis TaxID=79601 RepID=UPI0020925AC0|nr:hypothetical protein [Metallosphaera hakonensis]
MYALCLKGGGRIKLIPPISSKGYIYMTADVIRAVNGEVRFQDNVIEVRCGKLSKFRGKVPGDYALASFYAVGAILTGGKVRISNLYPPPNYVGDHVIVEMLRESGAKSQVNQDTWTVEYRGQVRPLHVSINDVPDLAPSLAGLMALGSGESIMEDVERLRLKESDRIATILDTLSRFGIRGSYDAGKITVTGGNPRRGEVECPNDHRIAMMAGDLALKAGGSVSRAECVRKSNPRFWTDISSLGGKLTLKGS